MLLASILSLLLLTLSLAWGAEVGNDEALKVLLLSDRKLLNWTNELREATGGEKNNAYPTEPTPGYIATPRAGTEDQDCSKCEPSPKKSEKKHHKVHHLHHRPHHRNEEDCKKISSHCHKREKSTEKIPEEDLKKIISISEVENEKVENNESEKKINNDTETIGPMPTNKNERISGVNSEENSNRSIGSTEKSTPTAVSIENQETETKKLNSSSLSNQKSNNTDEDLSLGRNTEETPRMDKKNITD